MNLKRMQVLLGDVWAVLRVCVCDRGVSLRVRRCEEVVVGVTVSYVRRGGSGLCVSRTVCALTWCPEFRGERLMSLPSRPAVAGWRPPGAGFHVGCADGVAGPLCRGVPVVPLVTLVSLS